MLLLWGIFSLKNNLCPGCGIHIDAFKHCVNFSCLKSDVIILVIFHQPSYFSYNAIPLRPKQDPLQGPVLARLCKALSCGRHVDIGQECCRSQQLVLWCCSWHQLYQASLTPGSKQVWDGLIIAGKVDQESEWLEFDCVGRWMPQFKKARQKWMELMMPVR